MSLEPLRAFFIHFHPLVQDFADVRFGADRATARVSEPMIARICAAFRRSIDRQRESSRASVWTEIGESYHREFVAALRADDTPTVRASLESMFEGTLTFGVDQWRQHVDDWHRHSNIAAAEGARVKDLLLRLAEAVGCARVENPEQSPWGWSIEDAHVESLVDTIEREIGVTLTTHEIADGRFGQITRRGRLSPRDLFSAHAACRVREVLDPVPGTRYPVPGTRYPVPGTRYPVPGTRYPVPGKRICEIGGGLGRVPLYLHRMGYRDISIVDLPVLNALQAFYLAGNGLESSLRLFGEPPAATAHIHLCPAGAESLSSSGPFDLVINQDSLPEMGAATATEYLTAMRDGAARLLLSQNHESRAALTSSSVHCVVAELAAQVGGFRRISRNPWWMRHGYVDEVYTVGDATPC